MSWKVEAESTVSCSIQDFYSGVDVWLERPQVVNRRLLGCVAVCRGQLSQDGHTCHTIETDKPLLQSDQSVRLMDQLLRCSQEEVGGTCSGDVILRRMLPRMPKVSQGLEGVVIDKDRHTVTFCPLEEATPTYPSGSYRLQLIPGNQSRIVLYTWTTTAPPTSTANGVTTPTLEWLKTVLLPKISQWSEENASHSPNRKGQSLIPLDRYSQLYWELKHKYGEGLVKNWPEATDPHKFVYEDISIATYLLVLWELERKELNITRRQSFIDLGCGNGLLVYLLTAEGHSGKGVDLRERRIWKMFRDKATLEVSTLTPSDETLFPDYDWLLGNHSDELTPWIPVMAARSSYHTRYFVLPCCPHDFESKYRRRSSDKSQYRCYLDYVREIGETMGFKVQEDTMRIPSSKRVCQIGKARSYPLTEEATVDKLRMSFLDQRCPSRSVTPRTQTVPPEESRTQTVPPRKRECQQCLPSGGVRDMSSDEVADQSCTYRSLPPHLTPITTVTPVTGTTPITAVTETIPVTQVTTITGSDEVVLGKWASGFQPRSSTEHVRNCSHVEQAVRELVMRKLTNTLLQTDNFISVRHLRSVRGCGCDGVEDGSTLSATASQPTWNLGGKLSLGEVAGLLDVAVLQRLKSEFGGLQTLLRNEHQVFQVCGGHVQLRNWAVMNQPQSKRSRRPDRRIEASLLRKTRPCWFYNYHPQGCPRTDTECSYAHGENEKRKRPDFGMCSEMHLP